jgi:transglutaminase-like putative cysteine protease
MNLKIYHRTEYHYEKPVHHSIQELRLIPPNLNNQKISNWKVYAPAKLTESLDAFGNLTHIFVMDGNYTDMIIEAEGEVESSIGYEMTDPEKSLSPYYSLQQTHLTQPSEEMIDYFLNDFPKNNSLPEILKLADAVRRKIAYTSGSTNFTTTAEQAFQISAGVCQDHAHIMLGLCRQQGIPARYISGYFHATNHENLASHAWVDVCTDISAKTWVSIDVTHACVTDERHVRLAAGRDYSFAAPVKGIRSGGGIEELQARISIQSIS